MLYFFLTLDDKEFEKFKKQVSQNKFILNVTLNNLKTIKGEVKINLNNENLSFANNIVNFISPTREIFPKLNNKFKIIIR